MLEGFKDCVQEVYQGLGIRAAIHLDHIFRRLMETAGHVEYNVREKENEGGQMKAILLLTLLKCQNASGTGGTAV